SRIGTWTSGLEPARYIFFEPGKGWIVKEERGIRGSSEITFKEGVEASDAVVWAGVIQTLSFSGLGNWPKELL
ncbi:MAG: hypothetical protein OEW33_11015, partial [Nitrospirota bacterium]|nr:hypothetical protein [Nitrospirota bacterium]